jgi:NADH dehydrogenase
MRHGSPQGAHAAATIIVDSKGRATKPFALSYLVLRMSLGPGDGLIQPTTSDDSPRGFTLKGKPGALFNEMNNRYARSILSWERRKAGTYR